MAFLYGFTELAFVCLRQNSRFLSKNLISKVYGIYQGCIMVLNGNIWSSFCILSCWVNPWWVPHDLSLNRGVTFLTHPQGLGSTNHEHLKFQVLRSFAHDIISFYSFEPEKGGGVTFLRSPHRGLSSLEDSTNHDHLASCNCLKLKVLMTLYFLFLSPKNNVLQSHDQDANL